LLTDATLDQISANEEAAQVHYDSVFAVVEEELPAFRIIAKAYLQAFDFFRYYSRCNEGVKRAVEFKQFCIEEGNDSLLMLSLLQELEMRECIDDSSYREEISDQIDAILTKHPSYLGVYFDRIGLTEAYFERWPQAIKNYLEAENIYIGQNNQEALTDLYISMADVYDQLNDPFKAKSYLLKAKDHIDCKLDHLNDDFYNTLGWIYYRNGDLDSALLFIRKSKHYHEKLSPGNPELAYPVGNLGLIFRKLGMLDSAAKYSEQAIGLFTNINHLSGVAEAHNNIGNIQLERGNFENALNEFTIGLQFAIDAFDHYEEMIALEGLFQLYQDSDPKKAFDYFKRFSELKLQFRDKEDSMNALQLEAAFYREQKQNEIHNLEYESKVKSLQLEQSNLRLIFISLSLVILLVLSIIIFVYWLQRKRLVHSLEDSLEVNQRIISMISHDFRGPLNNVKLTLELLQSHDINAAEFAILSKDLYRQSADLALMFDSFVGWAISQRNGYVPSRIPFKWSDVVEEVISISMPLAKHKNIKLLVKAHSSINVETDRMASLLILRNLISNAIKYSHHNSKIEIEYTEDKGYAITKVRDFGIGIAPDKLQKILIKGDESILGTNNEYGAGLGLRMVIKYVTGIGGTINAESVEKEGSTFTVSIPLKLKSAN